MTPLIAALGLSAAISLGACATGPSPFRLPQHNIPAQGASVMATGGRIDFDGRCVWLASEGGGEANLVWPTTFGAMAPPLEITGASGVVIIHEGDVVDLGVAEGHTAIPGCPVRPVWLVGEIDAVNGEAWPDVGPNAPTPGRLPGNPH